MARQGTRVNEFAIQAAVGQKLLILQNIAHVLRPDAHNAAIIGAAP